MGNHKEEEGEGRNAKNRKSTLILLSVKHQKIVANKKTSGKKKDKYEVNEKMIPSTRHFDFYLTSPCPQPLANSATTASLCLSPLILGSIIFGIQVMPFFRVLFSSFLAHSSPRQN